MNSIERKRYLPRPPFSEDAETFILPIARSQSDVKNGLIIGGGWRYFNELRVIQKHQHIYTEVIMSPKKLLIEAKLESKRNYLIVEKLISNITKKRHNVCNLDMSIPHIVGILNLTPDSFYKKSQTTNTEIAVKKSIKMISDGASVIDIGGESTRPGAIPISEDEELKRVLPAIISLKKQLNVNISLDTMKLKTMKVGVKNGVNIINDVTGFKNQNKIKFASRLNLPIVVMHMQNKPQNMQTSPNYDFAPIDIFKFFSKRISELLNMGVKMSNIIVDPGIGFGKNSKHNIDILRNLTLFHNLGTPILLGVSRKSFIGEITKDVCKLEENIRISSVPPSKRLSGSLSFAMHAHQNSVQFIRTHDVFETKQAIICQNVLS